MIVIEVVLYINSMLTDIHAIKEEEVFVLKKSKNQKTLLARKKKEIKRIAKRKVRISAIIVVFYYFLK